LGFDFHGGTYPEGAEEERGDPGTAPEWRLPAALAASSPLCGEKTQGIPGDSARGSGPGRYLGPLPGLVWKHFTGRDVVSRWDVLQAHTRATAATATQFLDSLQQRMPFPIRAVQVDGGSEFAAEFEQACQQRGLRLFVLPPRSPKLNGAVERAQRTHTEEFYQVADCSLEMAALNRELRDWEKTYNTIRPHQSLGYLTPLQFLQQWHSERKV